MPDDKPARVVKLAYELAQTGLFEDVAAVERELVAVGYGDEIHSLERPTVRGVIDEVCASRREREEPGSDRQSAV
jgi:hypothetical protein